MEIDEIKERYARREKKIITKPYSMSLPYVRQCKYEKTEVIMTMLGKLFDKPLDELKVLEVGCGTGGNLLNFLTLGLKPENLSGNDLLENRVRVAKKLLPAGVHLKCGDASELGHEKYDVVYASTVFSSILDDSLKKKLAAHMWDMLEDKGTVLFYDFVYNNPNNPDVKGVELKEIRELFPEGDFAYKRVTLAPPLGRFVLNKLGSMFLYRILNSFPFLRTHVVCTIRKN